MAAKESSQEAEFEKVSVSLIEEKEFIFDPYLFALSGNNIQQYCTMLSLLEPEHFKAEMLMETPQGISMPLSLVQMTEEFEVLQNVHQGPEDTVQTKLLEPQLQGISTVPVLQLQYDFAPVREGVLQVNPPGSLTASEVQEGTETRSSELASTGENSSKPSKSLKAELAQKGPMGDFGGTALQQKGSPQSAAKYFIVTEQSGGILPQRYEQNHPHNIWRPYELSEDGACKEDQGTAGAFVHIRQKSCPNSNSQGSLLNDSLPFMVSEDTQTTAVPALCPNCGRKLELNLNPTNFQQSFSEKESFGCPDCGCSFSYKTAGLAESQIIPADKRNKLHGHLNRGHWPHQRDAQLEKPFKGPDCGKGFCHRSNIPRHRRLHRKENSSPVSGQQNLKPLPHPKPLSGDEKPFHPPASRTDMLSGGYRKPSNLPSQCASTLNQVYIESDSLASKPCGNQTGLEKPCCCSECEKTFSKNSAIIQHWMLHRKERPFKCLYCDKSYTQKKHLKRHEQSKHNSVPKGGTLS